MCLRSKLSDETDVEVPQEVLEGSEEEMFYQVSILEEQLRGMNPDVAAIEAYRAKEAELTAKQEELAMFTKERDEVRVGKGAGSCVVVASEFGEGCSNYTAPIRVPERLFGGHLWGLDITM
jgi:hypothetical protein